MTNGQGDEAQSDDPALVRYNVVDRSPSSQQHIGRQISDEEVEHGSSHIQFRSQSQPGAFAVCSQHTSTEIESGPVVADMNSGQVSQSRTESPEAAAVDAELYEERTSDTPALQVDRDNAISFMRSLKRATVALTVILLATVSVVIASIRSSSTRGTILRWTPMTGWSKVGNTILGPTNQDNIRFGMSVAASFNGSRIAVGLPGLDLSGERPMYEVGGAFVFDFDGMEWILVAEIRGQDHGAMAGSSVKLSQDGKFPHFARNLVTPHIPTECFDPGNRLAIGCPGWSDNDGYAAVYEETQPGKWSLLGKIMFGPNGKGQHFGSELALSSDGTVIAIGSKFASTTEKTGRALQNAGAVDVFRFTGQEWKRLGKTINGEKPDYLFGWALAISKKGARIAATALGFGSFAGQVRVFDLVGGDWQRIGDDIVGTVARENLGASIALSEDGETLAVGATGYSTGERMVLGAGRIQIYQWKYSSWELDVSIAGESAFERLGSSVSLSLDGRRCAAGAPGGTGIVRVVEKKSAEGWIPVGSDLWDEGAIGGHFGGSISLSFDGNMVVVGAPLATFDALRSEVGRALVYREEENSEAGYH